MSFGTWTVVVVEDGYDDCQYLTRLLTHYGITVYQVDNGQDCLDLLSHLTPTCILTDLRLPRMDGWQLLVALRANRVTAGIPVIATSADYGYDLTKRVLNTGFDAFFAKPLHAATFVRDLQALLLSLDPRHI